MTPSELKKILKSHLWIPYESDALAHTIRSKSKFKYHEHTDYWVIKWPHAEAEEKPVGHSVLQKLRTLHYPMFNIEGYQLKLMTHQILADLQPNIIYVYPIKNKLYAEFLDFQGKYQKHPLGSRTVRNVFKELVRRHESSDDHLYFPVEYENIIFRELDCPRHALLEPDFNNQKTVDENIVHEILAIYSHSRLALFELCNSDNFLMEHKAIKTLQYIERYIPLEHIELEYVSPNVVEQLHTFREQNEPLDISTLEVLLFILNRCSNQGLLNPAISPTFVISVKNHFSNVDEVTDMIKHFVTEQQAFNVQFAENDMLSLESGSWCDETELFLIETPTPQETIAYAPCFNDLAQYSMFSTSSSNNAMIGQKRASSDDSPFDVTDNASDTTDEHTDKRARSLSF